jgi:hypothetical protein
MKPLLGCMLLALSPVPVATGMIDTVRQTIKKISSSRTDTSAG